MADIRAIETVGSLGGHYRWVLNKMPPADKLADKTIASLAAVIDMLKNKNNDWAVKAFSYDEDMDLFDFEELVRTQGKRQSSLDG